MSNYETMIQYIPMKKRKSVVYIQQLFKQINNDNRYLTNEIMNTLLQYYYFYMCFENCFGYKLSNIKFIYFVICCEYLNY